VYQVGSAYREVPAEAPTFAFPRGTSMPNCDRKTHLGDIKIWLRTFADSYHRAVGEPICLRDKAAENLEETYWNTIEQLVRPRLAPAKTNGTTRVDHHKIASTMELCVLYTEPIEDDSLDRMLELNAELALFIAKSIIMAWNLPIRFSAAAARCGNFDREHMAWLMSAETEEFPIFSNAATWFLYESLLHARRSLEEAGILRDVAPSTT